MIIIMVRIKNFKVHKIIPFFIIQRIVIRTENKVDGCLVKLG